jgi:hypothetical protein
MNIHVNLNIWANFKAQGKVNILVKVEAQMKAKI